VLTVPAASTAAIVPELVARLAQIAEPWQSAYSNSSALPVAVVFVHLASLLVGGGLALAADRGTLRIARAEPAGRGRHLEALAHTHRPVVAALALVLTSGLLLALTDVEEYATSRTFWVKMTLVALLLGNGALMTRTEAALQADPDDARGWSRLRASAFASGVLWLAVVLAGTTLAVG
jgi:hypothetical protein